jgi:hypothetical protein
VTAALADYLTSRAANLRGRADKIAAKPAAEWASEAEHGTYLLHAEAVRLVAVKADSLAALLATNPPLEACAVLLQGAADHAAGCAVGGHPAANQIYNLELAGLYQGCAHWFMQADNWELP